ncbi:MAG: outer membrane protein assembly factor BamA, partial [Candidatus Thioglobus sp.]
MKKSLFKFALIIGLLNASFAFAANIKNIEILGLNAISRGTVLSYLPVEVGDNYSAKTSSKIISALYKTNFFKDIEVTQIGNTLKIVISENPYIKYVEVLGYSSKVLDEDSVERFLAGMKLAQGNIFDKKNLNDLTEQLDGAYINQGYYNAKIEQTVEVDSQNRVGITVKIDEGDVARIKSMGISGNKTRDEEELLDLFEIGEADWFPKNFFTERDYYSEASLNAGIESLNSYYVNAGFLDFQILDVQSNLSDDKKSIDIAIKIKEGPEYKIGSIKFSGDLLSETNESLTKLLSIKSGDLFERKQIIQDINIITGIYTNRGYAFAKVNAATDENSSENIVDIIFEIIPNKKVYINRITISGNTRTQDEVVRREISVYESGIYSDDELEESINSIKRLGYFSNVKMDTIKVEGADDKINLNFNVKEAKTGTLSVGLSHSSKSGVAFNLGIAEKNFLGTGNTLNA